MMKRLIIIGLVILFGCDQNEPVQYVQLLQETSLKEGNKTTVKDHDLAFEIFFQNVNDSRCPINAACISAGNVKTTFVINGTQEVNLGLGQCKDDMSFQQADSAVFRIENRPYFLKLTEVSPYPVLPDEELKSAIISVFK